MKIHKSENLFCLSHTTNSIVMVESTSCYYSIFLLLITDFYKFKDFGEGILPVPSAPSPSLIFHVALLLPVWQNVLSDISFLLLVSER